MCVRVLQPDVLQDLVRKEGKSENNSKNCPYFNVSIKRFGKNYRTVRLMMRLGFKADMRRAGREGRAVSVLVYVSVFSKEVSSNYERTDWVSNPVHMGLTYVRAEVLLGLLEHRFTVLDLVPVTIESMD